MLISVHRLLDFLRLLQFFIIHILYRVKMNSFCILPYLEVVELCSLELWYNLLNQYHYIFPRWNRHISIKGNIQYIIVMFPYHFRVFIHIRKLNFKVFLYLKLYDIFYLILPFLYKKWAFLDYNWSSILVL